VLGEQRAARIMTWALALGAAVGVATFVLFYRYTDGWTENTTRPPQAYYQQVTPDDLQKWPWTYKNRLVVMSGDVRRVIDGTAYIDPLVKLFGRRLLGGLRVERQVLLDSAGQTATIAIDFPTPSELASQLIIRGRVLGPRTLSTGPLGDQPVLPVIEAYEVCSPEGACWSR